MAMMTMRMMTVMMMMMMMMMVLTAQAMLQKPIDDDNGDYNEDDVAPFAQKNQRAGQALILHVAQRILPRCGRPLSVHICLCVCVYARVCVIIFSMVAIVVIAWLSHH